MAWMNFVIVPSGHVDFKSFLIIHVSLFLIFLISCSFQWKFQTVRLYLLIEFLKIQMYRITYLLAIFLLLSSQRFISNLIGSRTIIIKIDHVHFLCENLFPFVYWNAKKEKRNKIVDVINYTIYINLFFMEFSRILFVL